MKQETERQELERAALAVARTLQANGRIAYWAGGAVRDRILGRSPRDIDVATDASPELVTALFPGAREIGKSFGVVGVWQEGYWIEVATFRGEADYADGRRPGRWWPTDARSDARRRDFTINALFYDPVADVLLDYVGGRADLAAGLIRAVGSPARRFAEDHLRILRAIRFAQTLDFQIEQGTWDAMRRGAAQVALLSVERIAGELTRILCEAARPGDALRLLREVGLLRVILPEIEALVGQGQPPRFHPEGNVFEHTVCMLNQLARRDPGLVFAALFHDVGKPGTAKWRECPEGGRLTFHEHAECGAGLTRDVLRRLRFSNELVEKVCNLVSTHMTFFQAREMRTATLRRYLAQPFIEDALELHRVDCVCSTGDLSGYEFMRDEQARHSKADLPKPWLTGRDLLALGLSEGPAVKTWLERAYNAQLEGVAKNVDALRVWVTDEMRSAFAMKSEAIAERSKK